MATTHYGASSGAHADAVCVNRPVALAAAERSQTTFAAFTGEPQRVQAFVRHVAGGAEEVEGEPQASRLAVYDAVLTRSMTSSYPHRILCAPNSDDVPGVVLTVQRIVTAGQLDEFRFALWRETAGVGAETYLVTLHVPSILAGSARLPVNETASLFPPPSQTLGGVHASQATFGSANVTTLNVQDANVSGAVTAPSVTSDNLVVNTHVNVTGSATFDSATFGGSVTAQGSASVRDLTIGTATRVYTRKYTSTTGDNDLQALCEIYNVWPGRVYIELTNADEGFAATYDFAVKAGDGGGADGLVLPVRSTQGGAAFQLQGSLYPTKLTLQVRRIGAAAGAAGTFSAFVRASGSGSSAVTISGPIGGPPVYAGAGVDAPPVWGVDSGGGSGGGGGSGFEIFATRALFVAAVDADEVVGDDVRVGAATYRRLAGSTVLPGLPGWAPAGEARAEHFGAVDDGTTDNTAAMAAVMAYCTATGETVLFPIVSGGVYLMDGITVATGESLYVKGVEGRRATLLMKDYEGAAFSFIDVAGKVRVSHLVVDFNIANHNVSGAHALRGNGCEEMVLYDVKVMNSTGYNIGIQRFANRGVYLERVHLVHSGNDGMDIKNGGDGGDPVQYNECVVIRDMLIEDFNTKGASNQAGLDLRGIVDVEDVRVVVPTRATGTSSGVRLRETGVGVHGPGGSGRVHGLNIEGAGASNTIGLQVPTESPVIITNVRVTGVNIGAYLLGHCTQLTGYVAHTITDDCIRFENAKNTHVSGCNLTTNGNSVITLRGANLDNSVEGRLHNASASSTLVVRVVPVADVEGVAQPQSAGFAVRGLATAATGRAWVTFGGGVSELSMDASELVLREEGDTGRGAKHAKFTTLDVHGPTTRYQSSPASNALSGGIFGYPSLWSAPSATHALDLQISEVDGWTAFVFVHANNAAKTKASSVMLSVRKDAGADATALEIARHVSPNATSMVVEVDPPGGLLVTTDADMGVSFEVRGAH